MKDSEAAQLEALQGVVAPIAKNLRAELSTVSMCQDIEGFVRSSFRDEFDEKFPGDWQLDRLEWAGTWARMISHAKIAAHNAIWIVTTIDEDIDVSSDEELSIILRTMLCALQKDDALPLRAKRFSFLHTEILEAASDSLQAMFPVLTAKAESYVTALHLQAVMTSGSISPSKYPTRASSTTMGILRSTFTAQILEPLVTAIAVDVLAAIDELLTDVFENRDKVGGGALYLVSMILAYVLSVVSRETSQGRYAIGTGG